MLHEMRAQYEEGVPPGDPDAPVIMWHMVRETGTTAMCGRELDAKAATRSADAWGAQTTNFCHTCGAMYLHEVP
ncbi:hypothetical protein [Streptomyces sp. H27-D2]|uniref:hypothetical protein n=1 Tax=Streptomyces sp. H27-D2 TaxID=3046304 RepID=UPI002DB91EDE|nr:hypothetical protein [Streptomyces sp. H27-D2]MEC4019518.1 hypothetical protein [Streptomyces sp. H27-D2]